MADEIPGFDVDDEMEELLTTPVGELDEDTRMDLQLYKSRKLQAKRDAGVAGDKPDWWSGDRAPETVETLGGDASGTSTSEPVETSDEDETDTVDDEATTEPSESGEESGTETTSTESTDTEDTGSVEQSAEAEEKEGVPQVGWSNKEKAEEADVSAEKAVEEVEKSIDVSESETEDQETDSESTEEPTDDTTVTEDDGSKSGKSSDSTDESGDRHAGKYLIHPGADPDDIPGFDGDTDLEEKLSKDITSFGEEERQEIQLYRSKKIQAMRDAGMEPTEVAQEAEVPPDTESSEASTEPSDEQSADDTEESESQQEKSNEQESEPEPEEHESSEASAPATDAPLHAGRFRIHIGPSPEDISGFDADPELEEKLNENIMSFDEEKRQEIQLYRSKKMQAMRDAGIEPDDSTSLISPEEADIDTRKAQTETESESSDGADEQSEPEESADEQPTETDEEETPDDDDTEVEEATEEPEEEQEEALSRDELSEFPSDEELIQAKLIEQEVEQDDSEGIFFTTVDRKKAYIAYNTSEKFITLYYFQIPTNVTDEELEIWIKDVLVRTAFEFAEENDLEVIPQASEVSKGYLDRHPEFRTQIKESLEFRKRGMKSEAPTR